MTTMVCTHLVYLAVSVAITVWVGRSLRRHGIVFASNGDEKKDRLVDSLAHLLEVGYYLLNFGVINLALKYGRSAVDSQSAIELVSAKTGMILLVLGATHLMMTAVFARIRRRSAGPARVDRNNEPGAWIDDERSRFTDRPLGKSI